MEFIFMLTRNDATVPDALDVYESIRSTDLTSIGFKDVGIERSALKELGDAIKKDGRTLYLEVVSLSLEDELSSVAAAVDVGVDYLLGGTHVNEVLPLLDGTSIRYCPFPGTIVGHPSELTGSLQDICGQAAEMTGYTGVVGVDLLAYRHREVDPVELTRGVADVISGKLVVAGSIETQAQIEALAETGADAFTIGSAIFNGLLHGAPDVARQIDWVMDITNGLGAKR